MSTTYDNQSFPLSETDISFHSDDYAEMIKTIGVDKFQDRFDEISKTMNEYLENAKYSDYVECNHRILLMTLLDYWSDIYRLKDFHLIEKARTDKIFPYLISWILRRKPLQYTKNVSEDPDIFVNERFATYLFLNECLMSHGKVIDARYQDKLNDFIEYVFYYFKYRTCNPQVIELMIRSFEIGSLTKSTE